MHSQAYTISMIANEHKTSHVNIVATDIDEKALGEAKQGIYPTPSALYPSCFESIPDYYFQKYFTNEDGDHWRAVDIIRNRIEWMQHDLLVDFPPVDSEFDLITCRNVLMYFSVDKQQKIMETMIQCLKKRNGLLLLGINDHCAIKFATQHPLCALITIKDQESSCLWRVKQSF